MNTPTATICRGCGGPRDDENADPNLCVVCAAFIMDAYTLPCPRCQGVGNIPKHSNFFRRQKHTWALCPMCKGRGKV